MARTRRQHLQTPTVSTSTETVTDTTSTASTTETTPTTETTSTEITSTETTSTTKTNKARNPQTCSNCHKLRNPTGKNNSKVPVSQRGQPHKCGDEEACRNWATCPVNDLKKRKSRHPEAKDKINKIL